VTEPRTWVADPTVPWNILLTASLTTPPDQESLRSRVSDLAGAVGWDGPAPVLQRADATDDLLRVLAAAPDDGVPVGVGTAGQELVVRAHHAAVDGLGLLAALGLLIDAPVTSSARGLPDGPARGVLHSVLDRLAEAAFAPPAVVGSTARRARGGDVFASLTVDCMPGTAEVVVAAVEVLANRVAKGDPVVAVGLSRSGGAAPRLGDDSAFVRLRHVRGKSVDEVRALLRETPAQGSPAGTGSRGALARAMRLGMRVLAGRLGSTVLVSHLGRVDAPGVERLAFYPVTGGGSGLSLGVVGHGSRTTLTLRGRGHQHDEEGLQLILEALCARLV
jgi:hypothetical protein